MKKLLKIVCIYAISLLYYGSATAQHDTTHTITDSQNHTALATYKTAIARLEEQKIADSVKTLQLKEQLNALKSNEGIKREAILKQLESLGAREAERIASKKAQIDALRTTTKGFPVTGYFKDTLFVIYDRLGSFSASQRAAANTERISNLLNTLNLPKDSLQIVKTEYTTDVSHGDNIITSISENDALWANATQEELAARYRDIIYKEVSRYKSETSVALLVKETAMALLAIALLFIIIRYTGRFFNWMAAKIRLQEGKRLTGFTIKNYTLFDSKRQVGFFITVNTVLKWLVMLLLMYITLLVLFGIFPWTKHFADTLFGYVLNPVKKITSGLWSYMPNLFTIIVVIIIFRYLIKGVKFFKDEIETGSLKLPGFYPDWAKPTFQIIKVLLYAFMFILVFPYLPGSESPIFRSVSVFLGFLFTFGSAGSLSNVVAGIVLTYMRLFKLGDRVKIGEVSGDVIEKSLLVTRIRTIKNEIISIPNSTVMSSHTINYSNDTTDKGLILHTTVTIGYDVPWKDMHQALLNAADRTDMILKDPKPFVLQTSLEDFYVAYQVNGYTKEANKQAMIYSSLHQNIQDCCNEAGIEILSPHYRASRDGNMTTIPASYLGENYQAPSFNIRVDNSKP